MAAKDLFDPCEQQSDDQQHQKHPPPPLNRDALLDALNGRTKYKPQESGIVDRLREGKRSFIIELVHILTSAPESPDAHEILLAIKEMDKDQGTNSRVLDVFAFEAQIRISTMLLNSETIENALAVLILVSTRSLFIRITQSEKFVEELLAAISGYIARDNHEASLAVRPLFALDRKSSECFMDVINAHGDFGIVSLLEKLLSSKAVTPQDHYIVALAYVTMMNYSHQDDVDLHALLLSYLDSVVEVEDLWAESVRALCNASRKGALCKAIIGEDTLIFYLLSVTFKREWTCCQVDTAISLLSCLISLFPLHPQIPTIQIDAILQTTMDRIWLHWESPQREIRKQSKALLEVLIQLFHSLSYSKHASSKLDLVKPLLERVLGFGVRDPAKYGLLALVIDGFGSGNNFDINEDIFERLMTEMAVTDFNHQTSKLILSFLRILSARAVEKSDLSIYIHSFLPPLIKLAHKYRLQDMSWFEGFLVCKIFDANSSKLAIMHILEYLETKKNVDLWLFFVRQGLTRNILTRDDIFCCDTRLEIMQLLSCHCSDTIRLCGLAVLSGGEGAAAKRPTLPERSLFRSYLCSSFDIPSGALRLIFGKYVEGFCRRVHLLPDNERIPYLDAVWTVLSEKSKSDDMKVSLLGLKIMKQILKFASPSARESCCVDLLHLLETNQFELCRIHAVDILVELKDPNVWSASSFAKAEKLMNHFHPIQRLQGAALWRAAVICNPEMNTQEEIRRLIYRIEKQLDVMEVDPINAVTGGSPVHGLLHAIHQFLPALSTMDKLSGDLTHQLFRATLRSLDVAYGFFTTQELFIREDGSGDDWQNPDADPQQADEDLVFDDFNFRGYTIAGVWRMVKVAALLMAELMSRMINLFHLESDLCVAYCEQVQFSFARILLDVRHWGVAAWVQEAYTTFCKVVSCSTSRPVASLIETWLTSTLSLIGGVAQERHDQRYSGLSRCIIALINGPTARSKLLPLQMVLDVLFEIAKEPIVDFKRTQRQVNALNMLRWLVEDKKLGGRVNVHQCLVFALEGYEAVCPYVRNSCTQLFSTVMSRVFRPSGIQAAASHSTIPADEFLFSNQKLYTRLMEIFCAVVREDTLQSYLSPGLFPSLILITRLGATRTSQLSDLSSILLEICYKSPIAKVREVAAVTVTKTTPGSELQSLVISAWAQVVESEHVMNENRLHGILVLSLKVAGSTASPETLDQLRIEVSRRKWMIGSRQSSYNRYYFLKLVSALNMPELLDVSIVAISSHHTAADVGQCLFQKEAAWGLTGKFLRNQGVTLDEVKAMLDSPFIDVQMGVLEAIVESDVSSELRAATIVLIQNFFCEKPFGPSTRSQFQMCLKILNELYSGDSTSKFCTTVFLDRIVEITDKEHFESSLRLLCLTLMGQCSILVHSRDLSFGFDVLSLWIKRLKSEPADQAVEIIVKIKSLIRLWALPRYRAELEPLLRNLLKESESVYLLDFVSQLLNTRVILCKSEALAQLNT